MGHDGVLSCSSVRFLLAQFGPLSGVTHELRVVSAYTAGQLQARSKEDACVKMCFECGKSGHFPRQCPSLLLE